MTGKTSNELSYRLAPRVIARYETQLGFGVIAHPGLRRSRQIDIVGFEVVQMLREEALTLNELANMVGHSPLLLGPLVRRLRELEFVVCSEEERIGP